jgi:hypothetical protein
MNARVNSKVNLSIMLEKKGIKNSYKIVTNRSVTGKFLKKDMQVKGYGSEVGNTAGNDFLLEKTYGILKLTEKILEYYQQNIQDY